ncbi:Flavocytochrome c [Penicillium cf. griseofulvum]|nr:Flavocytochrome c [Penicillium cf. griseofulvum]
MAAPQVIVVGGGRKHLSPHSLPTAADLLQSPASAPHTLSTSTAATSSSWTSRAFFGGNSTKATSGINGALTRTQTDLGIQDSVKQFYDDTLKSARDKARPELIKVLTYKSAAAVEWLQDVFDLDLTLFPGMAITYALMQRLEDLAEKEPGRVQIVKKANVTSVNKSGNNVTGVTYTINGEEKSADGVVVLATGGYAADFSETSLLKKHRPDTFGLSSTNGTHATGDGQKMLMAIGANGIDMDKVQVHPTGLVDPKDPNAKFKFLAAEALRGEGGLLLNSEGQRFSDELGHRDYVSGKMWEEKEKGKWPIRLVLNSKASKVLDFHTRHYSGPLKKTFDEYNLIADGKKKDPWNKRFFHNMPFKLDDEFHVALMEPVLHFTMGGIEIDEHAQVLNSEQKPFDGLYACGELAGGVHGANRLGGSSLLGCVVYGRVAGDSASQHLFKKLLNNGSSAAASRLGQISLHIDPSTPGKISVEKSPSTTPRTSLWVVVKGVVLDLTNWVDEHPGGANALYNFMGRDATEEFAMLHDDEVIPKYATQTVIGRVKGQTPSLEL